MVETRSSSRRRKTIAMLPADILMRLPYDILIYHILLKLPNKSLISCMCVSKQWHSFFHSNTFANLHLHRVTNDDHQNHHKLLLFHVDPPCNYRTIDCEAPHDSITVSRLPPSEVTFDLMWNLSSCNGLVWVGLKNSLYDVKFSDLILWNPLTSENKKFSKTTSHKKCYNDNYIAFELYYISSDDDYSLLHVTNQRDVYIYSMRSASWRKIYSFQHEASYSKNWHPSTCLNENLYVLRVKYRNERSRGSLRSYLIIRFDTKTEKFREIAIPSLVSLCSSITAQKGCIYLCVQKKPCIELWRMNGDEVWMKVSTILDVDRLLQPLHLMRNGNWLMSDTNLSHRVGHLRKVVLEDKDNKGETCSYSHGFHYQMSYVESFVSPNQYMK